MGLAKGKARRIIVDGRSFRWTISRARQASAGELDVVIELADRPKQRAVVAVACRNFWLDFSDIVESRAATDMTEHRRLAASDAYRPVTPQTVEQIVRAVLAAGWRPDAAGKPLRLAFSRSGSEGST